MRLIIFTIFMLGCAQLRAQDDDGWRAPEGFALNFRTLTWSDFQGKEDKDHAQKLAEKNVTAMAYVCPAIYFTADSGETQDNGRVKFKFHVKCAFQSRAFVHESTKELHTNYVLTHEQDHYDIALTYANKLQAELSSKDYSTNKYTEEINKICDELLKAYHKTQETYDGEVNPEGKLETEKQRLWDMRIKKCLENNSTEFYYSTEANVKSVTVNGQIVKRISGEAPLQFVVRARPLYVEYAAERTSRVFETKEWTEEPSYIAYYTQRYFTEEEGGQSKENQRILAYMFIPTTKDIYKRVLIDTISNEGKPVNIAATFFANADSDNAKELVIMATSTQKDKQATGTLYINRVYDNIPKPMPGKLKRLDDVCGKIEGGMEGTQSGKPSRAKYKSEKEVIEALKKMGFN
jgi:Bacterial protein of unknown function (DUF922)